MKIIKIICLVICVSLIAACSSSKVVYKPTDPGYNTFELDVSRAMGKIDSTEKKILTQNLKIAKSLAAYDYYSWVASDSILAKIEQEKLKIEDCQEWITLTGWSALIDSSISKVIFGHFADDTSNAFVEVAEVRFKDFVPQRTSLRQKKYRNGMVLQSDLSLIKESKEKFKKTLYDFQVPFNVYYYDNFDSRFIYFMPAMDKGKVIFGGGMKIRAGKFFARHHQSYGREFYQLHKSVMKVENYEDLKFLFRGSPENDIINEVDIAQFMMYKYYTPVHFIKTKKYIFMLKWDKKLNKIIIDLANIEDDNEKKFEDFMR